jgi:hypothetical protein
VAVYREKRRAHVWTWTLIGAAVLILVAIVAAVIGLNQPAPAGETPRGRVQAGLRDMSEALDLFTIEYPKLAAGQSSGAAPALTRARTAFDKIQTDLATLDPKAAPAFDTTLQDIERKAGAKASAADVVPEATQLRTDVRAWLQQP